MIYTFYSYKGGVGRSMALVNVAELCYESGLNVLVVDWDLEAPGLERFYPHLNLSKVLQNEGVMDLIIDYKHQMTQDLSEKLEGDDLPFKQPRHLAIDVYENHSLSRHRKNKLWLLTAGKRTDTTDPAKVFAQYANTVLTFDWQDFYANWQGASYFSWLIQKFEAIADIILIDSRTGITEMGGICTYQLADVIVMMCAANLQNLDGIRQMIDDFTRPEVAEARKRPLQVIPVPARIERSETKFIEQFKSNFLNNFAKYTPKVLGEHRSEGLWQLRIPYIPYYAYMESITVRDTHDAGREMTQVFARLTFVLSRFAAEGSKIRKAIPETTVQVGDQQVTNIKVGDQVVLTGESAYVGDRTQASQITYRERSYLELLYKIFDKWFLSDTYNYYKSTEARFRLAAKQVNRLKALSALVAGFTFAIVGLLGQSISAGNCAAGLDCGTLRVLANVLLLISCIVSISGIVFNFFADLFQWDRLTLLYAQARENLDVADAQSPDSSMPNLDYLAAFIAYTEGSMSVVNDETAQFGQPIRTPLQVEYFIEEARNRLEQLDQNNMTSSGIEAPSSQQSSG